MSKVTFVFDYPWLLLLLVLGLICTFIPYFRVHRRYRNTRNRIISITTVMLTAAA